MPRSMQFFDNTYPADADGMLEQLPDFDTSITICARPIGPWMRSAIKSPR